MASIFIPPSEYKRMPDCGWCGIYVSSCEVYGTPTCAKCSKGGRLYRIRMFAAQAKRRAP